MLLTVENLHKSFPERNVKAVAGVSFSLERGKTLGVIGESGSGKSTLAKLILGLEKPDEGQIHFHGKKMQAIFQHPTQSLNPKMRVREILSEPFLIQREHDRRLIEKKSVELLDSVELSAQFLSRFPRQLSGGECQRIAIARAICLEPELIVCDEAVSSLDLLVQAGILNLLLKLQKEKSVSYLFISHDPAVVRHMSDAILVMESGKGYNS